MILPCLFKGTDGAILYNDTVPVRDLAFMPMQNRTRLKIQLVRDDFVTSFF